MSDQNHAYRAELETAATAAMSAGVVILDFYHRSAAATYAKVDGSQVTDADFAADRAIREILCERFPRDAILSEEGHDDPRRIESQRCWIVDPIDGTEQFILRTGEFDVLVALVEDGRPVAVAGYQPTTQTLLTAAVGAGAWVRKADGAPSRIRFQPVPQSVRLATSKWFGAPENEAIIRDLAGRLGIAPQPPTVTGFSPRIFIDPRALDAIVGVRPEQDQTMAWEWDFAVADLVFREAGGVVTDLAGRPFRYNKPDPRNVGGLVAAVDTATHARILTAIADCGRHTANRGQDVSGR